MKPAARFAVILLMVIAAAHILRVLFGIPVTAGGVEFPMWASVAGGVLIGALAVWLLCEQRR